FFLNGDPEYLSTKDLLAELARREYRPWSSWGTRSGKKLANLLRPFVLPIDPSLSSSWVGGAFVQGPTSRVPRAVRRARTKGGGYRGRKRSVRPGRYVLSDSDGSDTSPQASPARVAVQFAVF